MELFKIRVCYEETKIIISWVISRTSGKSKENKDIALPTHKVKLLIVCSKASSPPMKNLKMGLLYVMTTGCMRVGISWVKRMGLENIQTGRMEVGILGGLKMGCQMGMEDIGIMVIRSKAGLVRGKCWVHHIM